MVLPAGFLGNILVQQRVSKSKAVELKVFEVSLSCPGSQSACEAQNLPHLHLFIWYLFPETDFGNSGGGGIGTLDYLDHCLTFKFRSLKLSNLRFSKSNPVSLSSFEV